MWHILQITRNRTFVLFYHSHICNCDSFDTTLKEVAGGLEVVTRFAGSVNRIWHGTYLKLLFAFL
jgi:hypothetical protein